MSGHVGPISIENVAKELLEYGFHDVKQLGASPLGQPFLAKGSICLNKSVAIKVIERGPSVKEYSEYLGDEILQHASLMHPLIVGCLETILTKKFICIVTELAPASDFPSLLRTQPGGRLTESTARSYFQQLVIALEYAHIRGVPIGNLRLEDLFLDSVTPSDVPLPSLKLCPFLSLSKAKFNHSRMIVARDASACDPFTEDIKAAGVILYQLLTGVHPCAQGNMQSFPPPDLCLSEEVQNLLSHMVLSKPEGRPTLQDIFTYSWFQQDLPPCAKQVNEVWLSVAAVLDEYPMPETPALLNGLLKRAEAIGNRKGDPFISVKFPCGMWPRREFAFQEQIKRNNHNAAGVVDTAVADAETASTATSSYFNNVPGSVDDTGYDSMGISDDNTS